MRRKSKYGTTKHTNTHEGVIKEMRDKNATENNENGNNISL